MTGDAVDRAGAEPAPSTVRASTRTSGTARFDRAAGADGRASGTRCGSTTTTSRWSSSRRSRSTGPRPRSGSLTQAYEERFLFLLLLLRQPRLRMIYVTSMPIAPAIVEYYLALLPGVIPSHARARLSLISVDDASPRR